MKDIEILVEKIIGDPNLMSQFAKLDSLEEMYDFCQTVHGGYTKDEFAILIDALIDEYVDNQSDDDSIDGLQKISDDDMQSLSGGVKIDAKKIMASGLASLLFTSGTGNTGVFAEDTSGGNSISYTEKNVGENENVAKDIEEIANEYVNKVEKPDNENETGSGEKKKESFWSKVKRKLVAFKDFLWRNKFKIAVGAAALAGLGFIIYKGYSNAQKNKKEQEKRNEIRDKKLLKFYNQFGKAAGREAVSESERDRYDELTRGLNDEGSPIAGLYNDDDWNNLTTDQKKERKDTINAILESNIANYTKDLEALEKGTDKKHNVGMVATVLSGIGAIGGGIKTVWDLVSRGLVTIGDVSNAVNRIDNAGYALRNLYQRMESYAALQEEIAKHQPFELKRARETFEQEIVDVKDQDQAIDEVRSFINRVGMKKEKLKDEGKEDDTAHVLVFNGPSGVGKSFLAGKLAKAMSTYNPFFIRSADIDAKNPNRGNAIEQMFFVNTDREKRSGSSSLYEYLLNHPQDGVVIVDEYDKISNSPYDPHPLDEGFRACVDAGRVTISGIPVDTRGTIFILTTNETDGSLNGKVYYDPMSGQLVDPTFVDDGTDSRTVVLHDKSFLNRITKVHFKNLEESGYEEIARDHFASYIDFARGEKAGGFDVTISDESYKKMAHYLRMRNEGARNIDNLLGKFLTALSDKYTDLQQNGDTPNGKKYEAVYEDNIDTRLDNEDIKVEFTIHQID